MEDCVFCKIIKKEINSDIIYEDDDFVIFKDINPKASTHVLIVPKKHIKSINQLTESDKKLMQEIIFLAKHIAKELNVSEGYKLQFNVEKKGGQEVPHIHLHLLSDL